MAVEINYRLNKLKVHILGYKSKISLYEFLLKNYFIMSLSWLQTTTN
jgi:hypothetical protein